MNYQWNTFGDLFGMGIPKMHLIMCNLYMCDTKKNAKF